MNQGEIFKNAVIANPLMKANDMHVTQVREGYAEIEMAINPHSLNPYGRLHGGVYFTLADCAAGCCARSTGDRFVTLNGNINYMKPVHEGKIRAEARTVHRGHTTCVIHVEVKNDSGNTLSDATFTMYRIPDEKS